MGKTCFRTVTRQADKLIALPPTLKVKHGQFAEL